MTLAGRVYDYLVWLMSQGYRVSLAISRAMARYPLAGAPVVHDMARLAVQSYAAGAATDRAPLEMRLDPAIYPMVPDRPDLWTYHGKCTAPDGSRFHFQLTGDGQLTLKEVHQAVRDLYREADLGDTVPHERGKDVLFPGVYGAQLGVGQSFICNVSRAERLLP